MGRGQGHLAGCETHRPLPSVGNTWLRSCAEKVKMIASLKTLTIIAFILCSNLLVAQTQLPKWGQDQFSKFARKYDLGKYLTPQFLEADFSGDKKPDLAIPIELKTDKKKGILILFAGSNHVFVIGAGFAFENAGDDFNWATTWSVVRDKVIHEATFKPNGDIDGERETTLERQAIRIGSEGESGGLIYFNGKKFIWIRPRH